MDSSFSPFRNGPIECRKLLLVGIPCLIRQDESIALSAKPFLVDSESSIGDR